MRRAALVIALSCGAAAFGQAPSPLFAPVTDLALDVVPRAVGDLDGDGDADLLDVGGPLINDGSGRFARGPATTLFADWSAGSLGDFDGDGLLDVVHLKTTTGSALHFARNLGGGGFASVVASTPAPPAALEIVAADFDGDGRAELMTNNAPISAFLPNPPSYWRSVGAFAFTDASATLPSFSALFAFARIFRALDLDGDADQDVLLVRTGLVVGVQTLINDGVGGFSATTPTTFPAVGAAVLADFDGDGDDDFATYAPPPTTFAVARFFVAFNGGGGTFAPPALTPGFDLSAPPWVAATDLDGDGAAEIVFPRFAQFEVRDVDSAGTVGAAALAAVGYTGVFGAGADLDGDGDLEILAKGGDATWQVYRGNGAGALVAGRALPPDSLFDAGFLGDAGALLVDATGDGRVDLVGASFRTAPDDGFGLHPTVLIPPITSGSLGSLDLPVAVADFDGDGDLDATTYATSSQTLRAVRNDGAPNYVGSLMGVNSGVTSMAAADFDADGRVDLAYTTDSVMTSAAWGIKILRNVGPGIAFAPPTNFSVQRRAHDMVVADFDADGRPDLAVAAEGFTPSAPIPSTIMLNDGLGGFLELAPFGYLAAQTVAAGDVDGDGDVDVVFDGVPWLRVPNAFVQGVAIAPPPSATAKHRLIDLDSDGDLDLLWGHRWFRNDGSGAFTGEDLPGATPGVDHFPNPLLQAADVDQDGDVDLMDKFRRVWFNRTRHLALGTPARLGRTSTIEAFGPSGAPFNFAVSLQRAAAPIPIPPWGSIFVDPGTLLFILPGTLDASGRLTLSLAIPASPALTGFSLAWQGILPSQGRLTGLLVPAVEPF